MSFRRGVMVAAAVLAGVLPATTHAQRAQQAVSIKLLPPLYDQPLRFVLNEPAYVAAFIVSPGEGVRMIYPLTRSSESLQWAGFHNEPLIGLHQDDDAYDVVFGRSAWSYASYGLSAAQGPRYLYVIASRAPLDVARFVHRPSTLQRTVGYENARSFDSEDAIDALLDHVVSLGADDSWDSDVFMLWAPDWVDNAPHSLAEAMRLNMPTRVVACRDGSRRVVPMNYAFSGCPGDARLRITHPVQPSAPRVAAAPESPTVLPTIRGVRMAQSPAVKAEPAVTGFLTTAAGGVSDDGVRVVDRGDESTSAQTLTVVDEVPAVIVDRGESRRERGDHDGNRDGDRDRDHRGFLHRADPVVGSTPQLAPAPRLAPNPALAPAPRLAPAPNVPSASTSLPRFERAEPARSEPARSEPVMRAAPAQPAPAQPAPAPVPTTPPAKVQ